MPITRQARLVGRAELVTNRAHSSQREIGITGASAAVANAVFDASGTRHHDLPITVEKVLAAQTA